MIGGVSQRLSLVPTTQVQLASSFVNRVTPANVGGMALNVRYLQKAGVPSTEAVTGMGLNVVAGGIVHIVLLIVFFAWAGRGGGEGFSIPSSSKVLVVIAVLLALVGHRHGDEVGTQAVRQARSCRRSGRRWRASPTWRVRRAACSSCSAVRSA